MNHSPLDPESAERLLSAKVISLDTGVGTSAVAALLDAARRPTLAHELRDEPRMVATIADGIRAAKSGSTSRSTRVNPRRRISLVAALAGTALAATSGLAFAGELPGAAQGIASDVLAKIGVTVPGPNSNPGTHPDVRGGSGSGTSSDTSGGGSGTTPGGSASGSDSSQGNGKGAEISKLARTTTASGRDKGAVISTTASGGKSHAGNPPSHPAPPTADPQPPRTAAHPRVGRHRWQLERSRLGRERPRFHRRPERRALTPTGRSRGGSSPRSPGAFSG